MTRPGGTEEPRPKSRAQPPALRCGDWLGFLLHPLIEFESDFCAIERFKARRCGRAILRHTNLQHHSSNFVNPVKHGSGSRPIKILHLNFLRERGFVCRVARPNSCRGARHDEKLGVERADRVRKTGRFYLFPARDSLRELPGADKFAGFRCIRSARESTECEQYERGTYFHLLSPNVDYATEGWLIIFP